MTDTNQSADTIFGDDFEVDYPKQLVVIHHILLAQLVHLIQL